MSNSAPRSGSAKVMLFGLPHDANSTYLKGPAKAPPLIREAIHSDSANMWTESGLDLGLPGLLGDAGDLAFPAEGDDWAAIESALGRLIRAGDHPLCLGGDHAVTWPVLKAAAPVLGPMDLLHFDAHPDLYPEMEGNEKSHACPMARIKEQGLAERLVQVGIRTLSGVQAGQAEKLGVEIHLFKDGLPGNLAFERPVWISFDLDALNPAFAPGVSHFEPGGMSTRQALDLIHGFKGRLVGADLVEFNPDRDRTGMTAMVAAKLAKELAGRILIDNNLAKPLL